MNQFTKGRMQYRSTTLRRGKLRARDGFAVDVGFTRLVVLIPDVGFMRPLVWLPTNPVVLVPDVGFMRPVVLVPATCDITILLLMG